MTKMTRLQEPTHNQHTEIRCFPQTHTHTTLTPALPTSMVEAVSLLASRKPVLAD